MAHDTPATRRGLHRSAEFETIPSVSVLAAAKPFLQSKTRGTGLVMFGVDNHAKLVVKIPGVLTSAECAELMEKIDRLGPHLAPINTAKGTRVRTDIRNNERVIFDDLELAQRLYEKAKPHVPAEMFGFAIVGANERFRCYRYKPGMRFAPHTDGSFERNEAERSFYTYLVYLNEQFEGGETIFATSPELSVKPITGMGLIFQHPLIHEGAEVVSGVKFVARTDLMYRRFDQTPNGGNHASLSNW